MFRLAILLAVVAVVLGAVLTEDKEAPELEGRIIGGVPASINSFPYLVSVQENGFHICGGVIISQDTIVTAAICVIRKPSNTLQIRAGSNNWNKSGVAMGVVSVRVHEKFNSITLDNNIALMRLSNPLPIMNGIRAIPLARVETKNGTAALISGWGVNVADYPQFPLSFRIANVDVIDRSQCGSKLYGYGAIGADMICAASPGRDGCDGDQGGPLVVDYVLVGIGSWGYGCANPIYPGVYTNIARQIGWILNITKTL